jgi:hypothetical protein
LGRNSCDSHEGQRASESDFGGPQRVGISGAELTEACLLVQLARSDSLSSDRSPAALGRAARASRVRESRSRPRLVSGLRTVRVALVAVAPGNWPTHLPQLSSQASWTMWLAARGVSAATSAACGPNRHPTPSPPARRPARTATPLSPAAGERNPRRDRAPERARLKACERGPQRATTECAACCRA